MHAIWVIPFFLFKIVLHDVIELHFGVPSTIDEDLAFTGKGGVTSSSFWRVVVRDDFLPSFGLQIEAVEIVESNSRVAETSMSSEDVNLVFVNDSRGVSSWRRSTNGGLEILSVVLLVADSSPGTGLHFEEPGIVKSACRTVMSTEVEHSIALLSILDGHGNMLCSSKWLITCRCGILGPSAIV